MADPARPAGRRLRRTMAAAGALGLTVLVSGNAAALDLRGLRLGMTVAEARAILPDLIVRGTPYAVVAGGALPRPDDGMLMERYTALELSRDGATVESVTLHFTGEPRLYDVVVGVERPGLSCTAAFRRAVAEHGWPDQRQDRAALWVGDRVTETLQYLCVEGSAWSLRLTDRTLMADWRMHLEAEAEDLRRSLPPPGPLPPEFRRDRPF